MNQSTNKTTQKKALTSTFPFTNTCDEPSLCLDSNDDGDDITSSSIENLTTILGGNAAFVVDSDFLVVGAVDTTALFDDVDVAFLAFSLLLFDLSLAVFAADFFEPIWNGSNSSSNAIPVLLLLVVLVIGGLLPLPPPVLVGVADFDTTAADAMVGIFDVVV